MVEMVSMDCAVVDPGVTVAGLKEQDDAAGRLEQPSVTLLLNAPPCADTVTV